MKTIKTTFTALFCLSVVSSFVACKKNDITYSFSGRVTQSINGTGLQDVTITLSQVKFSSSAANSNFQFAGETATDLYGNYSLVIDREKAIEFKLSFSRDGYFKHDAIIGSSEIKTDEDNVVDLQMDAESWVVFQIENLEAEDDDQLTFVKYNFREDCSNCGSNEYIYLEGDVDTTLSYRTTGGVYANFSYKDESSGSIVFDSVYTTPFDTTYYSINY